MAMTKDQWNDISVETYREYIYPTFTLKITSPTLVNVATSSMGGHSHRVQTADGLAYYIAPGWVAIRWQVKEGNSLFKF
jgi:hypothetical protein